MELTKSSSWYSIESIISIACFGSYDRPWEDSINSSHAAAPGSYRRPNKWFVNFNFVYFYKNVPLWGRLLHPIQATQGKTKPAEDPLILRAPSRIERRHSSTGSSVI